ncbi:MAG TPA: RNA polymerase sigma factor [Thermoanaerobaculia bacterium]|nr:RNA polymerase sigma factor [Thermoanaerobaculia bacterium]
MTRALVLRAQSGDHEAFDALLRELGPALLRYVVRVTGDVALAEDVVQETFIAIVRKIAWLSDASLFNAWAYRIASREAFRVLRKRKQLVEEVELATFDEPADPWQRERLLASIDKLSPASRAVITLHYLEQRPLSEVAAILDLSAGTVKSRLAYGLARLRKENT